MPPGQRPSSRHQPVGAGRRQPVETSGILRDQLDAVGHPLGAVRIVGTTAGAGIEKLAGKIGEMNAA